MEIITLKNNNLTDVLEVAQRALNEGKAVVYPTDTSYGLGVDATNAAAARRLYQIKGREFTKPVHITPQSIAEIKYVLAWSEYADLLAHAFWPGPLTIVLPIIERRDSADDALEILSAGTGWIGVRMPDYELVSRLTALLGRFLTNTSANVAGLPDCYDPIEIIAQFKGRQYEPDIVIDAGILPKQKPSTVIRLEGGELQILREGPVTEQQLMEVLAGK